MIEPLAQLLKLSQLVLMVGFVVFLRIGAAMAMLPAFGERSVPLRVRLGLALAFTLVVTPAVAVRIAPLLPANLPLLLATETVAGLSLGIVLRLFVLALQTAGAMAAQATSLSQLFGAGALEPQPAIGHIMLIAGLALAVSTGLHVRLSEAFIGSYAALPPGRLPGTGMIAEWGMERVAQAFSLGFSLAAPFLIAAIVYNLALGVINRAMPQLMVAFVGAPAITAGGLILLFLVLPALLSVWNDRFSAFMASPFADTPQ